MKKLLLVSALGLMGLASTGVHAESQLVVGAGSAAAKLDFRVIIPRVLFLGVGTGGVAAATPATVTTVDMVTFDYTTNAAAVGTGAAAASIANTGPVPAGATLPVKVIGNNGVVTLTSTNSGNLVNAATPTPDTIAFAQITATSSATAIPVPAASGATVTLPVTGKITNATANWTFAYANAAVVSAGTYNGRVTYTASMP